MAEIGELTTPQPNRWSFKPLVIQVAFVLVIGLLWEAAIRFHWVDQLFLASPAQIFQKLVPTTRIIAPDLLSTGEAFITSFVLGIAGALLVGFCISSSAYAQAVLIPILAAGVTIPKVTLLPLFILWFGLQKTTVIIYGALSAFFPMAVNVAASSREVPPRYILLARAMGYGRLRIFLKVMLPAMLPVLTSGAFYSCNAAIMGVFIVEMSLSNKGMGAVVHRYAMTFQTGELYAAVVLTVVLSVLINLGLWRLSRYFGRWRNY